jgi:uncharacterized protein YoxC
MSDEEELAFLERDLQLAQDLTRVLKAFDASKVSMEKLSKQLTALTEEYADILPKPEEKVHMINELI